MKPISSTDPYSRDYRQLYTLLVENLKDVAIFATDPKGIITSWNAGVERILGYTQSDFIGRPIAMLFTPADQAAGAPQQERDKAAADGRAADNRWHVTKSGGALYVNGVLSPLVDDNNDLIGFAKIMHDNTQEWLAEQELRQKEERLRLFIENVHDYALLQVDSAAHITQWNAGAERLFGYTEPEVMEQPLSMLFPNDSSPDEAEQELKVAAAEGRAERERPLVRKDGTTFLAQWVTTAMRDESGCLRGFAKVLQDVTEQRRHQEERERFLSAERAMRRELEVTAQSLARSNDDLQQFASAASHDLQEPLRVIGIYAELLSRKYQPVFDEEGHNFLSYIHSGVGRMSRLIQDLLAYSQMTVHESHRERVAAERALTAALLNLQMAITESQSEVTYDALPVVEIDPQQLTQVFQNLIGNAIKYRKPNQPARIHVSAQKRDGSWLFSVRDDAIGFSPEHSEAIFSVFKRLHGQDYPGTGIGLATCRRIVERHGGRIWAESKVGEGSIFYFTLPENPA